MRSWFILIGVVAAIGVGVYASRRPEPPAEFKPLLAAMETCRPRPAPAHPNVADLIRQSDCEDLQCANFGDLCARFESWREVRGEQEARKQESAAEDRRPY